MMHRTRLDRVIITRSNGQRTKAGKGVFRLIGECLQAGGIARIDIRCDRNGNEVATGSLMWRKDGQ